MGLEYGGKTTDDYSAMRGPCGVGFHVPLKTEWQKLKTMMDSLSFTTGDDWRIKLHMPFSGKRAFNNAALNFQGVYGCYWTCMRESGNNMQACHLNISSSQVSANYITSRADSLSIRPFKDVPVIPTSSRTTIYEGGTWGDGTNWYTPGIFWDQTNGLISISSNGKTTDSSVWITITDKNLGATTVYSDGNTLSQSNCGNYFQRGNGYGFAWSGSITTSQTQVDASGYGPGNYYSGNTFIIGNQDWSSVQNDNLRGGVTGIKHNPVYIVDRYYGGKTIQDYSAMRGPCPEGFHIPKSSERSAVVNTGVSLGARTTSGTTSVTNFRTYLKLPNIVYLFPGNGLPGTGWTPQHRYYWGCRQTGRDGSGRYCDALDVVEDYGGSIIVDNVSSNHGCPVRPFKDKPVIPDSSRTTLYASDVYPASRNIKHSQSLGLITISYDGTYITIADKNAGATSVYNFGDTITSANGGGLYQWGNNYPFPINGATTTSSTRVDTTGYGPGNYYSGSTFITGSVNDDWFSPRNRDLWGGVTGIQQKPAKVTEVYYNTTKIRPFYPAGIYWNPSIDGGVISISSNGVDWLTLADKNLGATTAYNLGDTMSEANCGKFYQRGNNYGFPYTGTPSRSSTKVDVSSYGPNNYYSNSTFRRVSYSGNWRTDGSTTAAFNLWGGVTGTLEAMQGPCPNGFHIPSRSDITNLVSMYAELDILFDTDSQAYLKIPRMGIRDNYNAAVNDAGTDGGFRSCTINTEPYESTYYPYACECWNQSQYQIQLSTGHMNSYCLAIRPFKNEAIMPTDEWTKLL